MPLSTTHSETNLANGPVYSGLTALAGGGNPGATLVNSGYNIFSTSATTSDSAQMQVSAPNRSVEVLNEGAATLRLWTNEHEQNAVFVAPTGSAFTVTTVAGVGSHIEIAAGANARIVCGKVGTWNLLN